MKFYPIVLCSKMHSQILNFNSIGIIMAGSIKKLAENWRKYFPKSKVSVSAKNDHSVLCEGLNLVYDICKEKSYTPENILDVGCSDGFGMRILKNYFPKAKVCGITINPTESMLGETEYGFSQGKDILLMDMHDMTFEDRSFDLIYCRDVLEHSISPLIALYEMNRVLKNDAYAFIIVPDERSIDFFGHTYVLNEKQLKHIYDKAGFEIVSYSFRDYPKFILGQNRYVLKKIKEPVYNVAGF